SGENQATRIVNVDSRQSPVDSQAERRAASAGPPTIDYRLPTAIACGLGLGNRSQALDLRMPGWLFILIMIALGAGFALISVLLQSVLGRRQRRPENLAPSECGMPPVGAARERQAVKFSLVAMIFLLFDSEVAVLYPWAMALRDLGWNGFAQALRF